MQIRMENTALYFKSRFIGRLLSSTLDYVRKLLKMADM